MYISISQIYDQTLIHKGTGTGTQQTMTSPAVTVATPVWSYL